MAKHRAVIAGDTVRGRTNEGTIPIYKVIDTWTTREGVRLLQLAPYGGTGATIEYRSVQENDVLLVTLR